jgi:hypothetical protein
LIKVDISPLTKAFPKGDMYTSLLSVEPSLKPVSKVEPKVEESVKNEVITHEISADVSSERQSTNEPCSCRKKAGFTSGWCGVAGGGVPACDH